MTDEESKRVTFSFAKKKLTLQARGAETGRSKVEMALDYDGKAIEIEHDVWPPLVAQPRWWMLCIGARRPKDSLAA